MKEQRIVREMLEKVLEQFKMKFILLSISN